jgi:hypothetical protein
MSRLLAFVLEQIVAPTTVISFSALPALFVLHLLIDPSA